MCRESTSKENGCPQEYPQAESGTVSSKQGHRHATQPGHGRLWTARRKSSAQQEQRQACCHLPTVCTWHLAWGQRVPCNPHPGKKQRCLGEARTGLQGSPPGSKDIIGGKEVPVYQDQSQEPLFTELFAGQWELSGLLNPQTWVSIAFGIKILYPNIGIILKRGGPPKPITSVCLIVRKTSDKFQ